MTNDSPAPQEGREGLEVASAGDSTAPQTDVAGRETARTGELSSTNEALRSNVNKILKDAGQTTEVQDEEVPAMIAASLKKAEDSFLKLFAVSAPSLVGFVAELSKIPGRTKDSETSIWGVLVDSTLMWWAVAVFLSVLPVALIFKDNGAPNAAAAILERRDSSAKPKRDE